MLFITQMADAGGMLLEEELFKVSEAVVLFLQGLGHIASTPLPRASLMKNSASMEVIQEHAGLTAVGFDVSAAQNEKAFNNRDQDEVIAVSPGERMPLMQENLCWNVKLKKNNNRKTYDEYHNVVIILTVVLLVDVVVFTRGCFIVFPLFACECFISLCVWTIKSLLKNELAKHLKNSQ